MPNEGEIDCVFSGYVYGGKVIFPFVSGLYARSLDGSMESCSNGYFSKKELATPYSAPAIKLVCCYEVFYHGEDFLIMHLQCRG